MRLLKYFLLFTFFLFIPKTYAYETKTIYAATDSNWASQILSQSGKIVYNSNTNGGQTIANVGTVNANANYGMYFGIYNTIVAGKAYNVKINFNDYDVRRSVDYSYIHINNSNCIIQAYKLENTNSSGNGKTINFTFSCPSPSNAVYFQIFKESDGFYYVTTVNWRLNSVQIEEASDGSQNIINNQTQNTQNIINNQNSNTQEIIDNQNANTQQEIESQKSCEIIDKNNIIDSGKVLNSNGSLGNNVNYGVTDYINIYKSEVKIKTVYNYSYAGSNICYYDVNKNFISCENQSNLSTLTIPSSAYYLRTTIYISESKPTLEICKNGNQAVSDGLNDLNDSIKDDDIGSATSDAGDFITGFDTNTFGLTSIITAPLNLIQSITSSTCTDLQIPLPYLNDKKLTLPCMTPIYQTTFGSLFTLYQTITFGIIAYWICVRIFNMVKDFKNPDHDEIEVVDL